MNKYSILIPHFKTWKMTTYCISKVLEHSKGRDIEILVCDNSAFDNSMDKVLAHFTSGEPIRTFKYPTNLLQSHGIGFDFLIRQVTTEYFITLESDSFPTSDGWLSYYDRLIEEGYDMGGSYLKLSGGSYVHPAGAFYKKSNWILADHHLRSYFYEYYYYPNAKEYKGFKSHAQVKIGDILNNELDQSEMDRYLPCARSVFHQGMGAFNEDLESYGSRNINSDGVRANMYPKANYISRMGYEPAQWFCYWHKAFNKKIYFIPTQVVWMPQRVNQQQEYTLSEHGVKHLWGVSAYHGCTSEEIKDIITFKESQVEALYTSLGYGQGVDNQDKHKTEG